MSEVMIVGLLSLAGTLVGSIMGIMTANKMTNYRIEQLEKKVEKHNSVIERTVVLERDQKTLFKYVDEIKDELKEEHRQ